MNTIIDEETMQTNIMELLNGKDFSQILREYHQPKFALLNTICDELYLNACHLTEEQQDELKEIYRKEAIMFNLTDEPVMLISDTHMASSFEEREYLNDVFDFCRKYKIQKLIHGGDIGDGTYELSEEEKKLYQYPPKTKPVDFQEAPLDKIIKGINNIEANYPKDNDIAQFLLGGNHDDRYRYSQAQTDILISLSQTHNIEPLGYYQAFFKVYGYPISLEHENRRIYPIALNPTYIPHILKIKGHSHMGKLDKNILYLPTLSKNIDKKKGLSGLPGFMVMQASQHNEELSLYFEHYYYGENGLTKKEEPYILKRTKK